MARAWFNRVVSFSMKVVGIFNSIYDRALENVLSIRAMHTYYSDPDSFIRYVGRKYFKFSEAELATALADCPLSAVGEQRVAAVARKRILMHAFYAGVMTFVCALPQNWVMWLLMVVDIVFFQIQVFAVSQELYILYKPKSQYRNGQFDYATLASSAVVMQGTLLKHKVVHQSKKVVGKVAKWLVRRGSIVFRGFFQTLIRQGFKWLGITVTKDILETSLTLMVAFATSLIAGLISFWVFLPMGRRLQRQLQNSDNK